MDQEPETDRKTPGQPAFDFFQDGQGENRAAFESVSRMKQSDLM